MYPEIVSSFVVSGIPLILVVFGLVEFAKKLGLGGNALTVLSLVLGFALAVAYQATTALPADPFGWFTLLIVGIVFGLVASGVYDFANARWPAKTP